MSQAYPCLSVFNLVLFVYLVELVRVCLLKISFYLYELAYDIAVLTI